MATEVYGDLLNPSDALVKLCDLRKAKARRDYGRSLARCDRSAWAPSPRIRVSSILAGDRALVGSLVDAGTANIAVGVFPDESLAESISSTWSPMTRACHDHPYELSPTQAELERLFGMTARFVVSVQGAGVSST